MREELNGVQIPLKKLMAFMVFCVALMCLFPQIKTIPFYNEFLIGISVVWILLAWLNRPQFLTRMSMHNIAIFFFIAYTFFVPYLFGNGVIGNRYLMANLSFVFYLIYQYNSKNNYVSSSYSIIKWLLPFIIYTSIVTLYGLYSNPYLSRSIKSSGEQTAALYSQGIGGYDFIYFLTFVCIMLLFFIYNYRKFGFSVKMKFFGIVIFSIFLITVLFANYLTALVLIAVSFIVIVVMNTRKIIIKMLYISIGFVLLFFWQDIFFFVSDLVIKILEDGATVEKLLQMQSNLMGSGGESVLSERMSLMLMSIESFMQNKVTGIIVDPSTSANGYMIGFGQHSYIVDTFALFGIGIGLLNVYILFQPFVSRMKRNRILLGLNISMLIATFLFLMMDNIAPTIGFAIFFIYPVIYDWANQKLEGKI